MDLNLGREIAALTRMTVNELRAKYAEVFDETTNARHKQWLVRRIAWRMQALVEGDLSERARQRAADLARDADLRTTPPKSGHQVTPVLVATAAVAPLPHGPGRLMPGTILTRQYKGQLLTVHVLPQGFDFEGQVYKSLSAVAKKITGSHCNGYHFFHLNRPAGDQ